jgi:hypothetical protein
MMLLHAQQMGWPGACVLIALCFAGAVAAWAVFR